MLEPYPPLDAAPCLAVASVVLAARQLGSTVMVADLCRAVDSTRHAPPMVAIVALHGPTAHATCTPERDCWELGARITAELDALGVEVVALDMGAGAGAVAACTARGAFGLLSLDDLGGTLARIAAAGQDHPPGARTGGVGHPGAHHRPRRTRLERRRLPAPFDGLEALTGAERRVLQYLMAGHSTAEIADALVVSLSTVRSHVRSILRKLQVPSQLAAVAVATGTRPGPEAPAAAAGRGSLLRRRASDQPALATGTLPAGAPATGRQPAHALRGAAGRNDTAFSHGEPDAPPWRSGPGLLVR